MAEAHDESFRLFYAIWPDPATSARLLPLLAPLHGRKTRQADLHLTLAFLGNQPSSLLPVLEGVLKHLRVAQITLEIDRLGQFPRNRITWAGMTAPPAALFALQKELVEALSLRNVAFEREAVYRPHITLARSTDAPAQTQFPAIRWRADKIVLARSTGRSSGPKYEILARH